MLRSLKAAIIALSINSCAVAYPVDEYGNQIQNGDTEYHETCGPLKEMALGISRSKQNPIFISGNSDGYATIVYINLKTEESTILRVNKDVGCIISEGIDMFLKFPQGIQEI